MMVELALAAIALTVWLNVQPGLLRDLAFVTMFIASISTVMFNGNPLLRFDAYYILCDALGLPNLEPRSKAWWAAVISRALGGGFAAKPVQPAHGELKWLALYAPLSFAFRIVIACVIVLWIGAYSSALGVVAALAFLGVLIVKPAISAFKRISSAARVRGSRARLCTACVAAAGVFVALCAVPLPFHTVASGIVWPPEQAVVRPGTNGFVAEILARDGDWVSKGQVLVVLDDPAFLAERVRLVSRLEQMQAGRFASFIDSAERVRRSEEEIGRVQSELERVEQRIAELELRSQTDGRLVMPRQHDLPGSYIQQGTTLGHVLDERTAIDVRAAVPEYEAVLVREGVRRIDVRIAGETETLAAELVRDVPAATFELPSAALGDRGGGPHPTDPADKDGLRTREPVVVLDLSVPARTLERIGGKVWVRFDHGAQSLAQRWYRQARQALLQHFSPAG
jgi:putative peptide zinc metalloprotease protein